MNYSKTHAIIAAFVSTVASADTDAATGQAELLSQETGMVQWIDTDRKLISLRNLSGESNVYEWSTATIAEIYGEKVPVTFILPGEKIEVKGRKSSRKLLADEITITYSPRRQDS